MTDEARKWLVDNGYDEAMGARPMARVIQQHIKTPLADEVLFGRLKNGGTVRVVVSGADESGVKKLSFVFPDGPVLPRPERDILEAGKKRKARDAEASEEGEANGSDDDSGMDQDGLDPKPVGARS